MNEIEESSATRLCPNGHVVSEGMKFCPVCGMDISLGAIRFCPNCGNERQQNDRFCSNCGMAFFQQPRKIVEKSDDSSFFGFVWIDF